MRLLTEAQQAECNPNTAEFTRSSDAIATLTNSMGILQAAITSLAPELQVLQPDHDALAANIRVIRSKVDDLQGMSGCRPPATKPDMMTVNRV